MLRSPQHSPTFPGNQQNPQGIHWFLDPNHGQHLNPSKHSPILLENYRIPKEIHWFLDPNYRNPLNSLKHLTCVPHNYKITWGIHWFLNPNNRKLLNSLRHSTIYSKTIKFLQESIDFSAKCFGILVVISRFSSWSGFKLLVATSSLRARGQDDVSSKANSFIYWYLCDFET